MTSPYADADYCSQEYHKMRKLMGSKDTTSSQWDAMERVGGFMYLYCPTDMTTTILALNLEMTTRRAMLNI